MKFFHLSDLHLGKSVHEFSMLEDQKYILGQIIEAAQAEKPDAVLIAGDVFDRAVAPTEALHIFESFVESLLALGAKVLVSSGNHDSADRLSFGARFMRGSGLFISDVFSGKASPITLSDEHGEVDFYLLPFIKPANVRRFFPDAKIETWTDALSLVIGGIAPSADRRSVLLAHQFVTGSKTCDSEELSIGGADNVDVEVFVDFNYVALGHLHCAQSFLGGRVRYCGTPLKYSFSESGDKKTLSIINLDAVGDVSLREIPLLPLRDMREVKGLYLEVSSKQFYDEQSRNDYLHITLCDEDDQIDALAKLRIIYPNLMRLDYDNTRTRQSAVIEGLDASEALSPLEIFEKFYLEQNGLPISDEQRAFLNGLIEEVWQVKQ